MAFSYPMDAVVQQNGALQHKSPETVTPVSLLQFCHRHCIQKPVAQGTCHPSHQAFPQQAGQGERCIQASALRGSESTAF